jgi:L-iditol 2-dehydrogenase
VQVAVQATGLCGSDLHYFNHFAIGDIAVQQPLTLGHESSGTVVAVGSSVSDLKAGDRVALEVGVPCESCEYCESGRYNICRGMRFRSSAKIFPHAQGTLQERINHPARWCHKLSDGLTLDLGALMEPLSVAMHAADRAALPAGATVLVLGAGAVGLLTAAVTKASDAAHVVIADIQKDRVDFALANGFADAGIVVPMARPQTIEDKLKYAREVAELIRTAKIESTGEEVGEVGAVYECTGVETCVQTAIYVRALQVLWLFLRRIVLLLLLPWVTGRLPLFLTLQRQELPGLLLPTAPITSTYQSRQEQQQQNNDYSHQHYHLVYQIRY